MKHILIGATGSVASLKLPILVNELKKLKINDEKVEIRVVVTENAKHFYSEEDFNGNEISEKEEKVKLYDDSKEWSMWSKRGDPVLHIELAKWADVFTIAPLDANTLAKIASGLCDNLLTCVARAWDPKKPLLYCPAMNTKMWEHPVTSKQIEILNCWGFKIVPCIEKILICGDTGLGAMAEVTTIVKHITDSIS